MRASLIVTLSSVLFKSYLRSSRRTASISFLSRPRVMLLIDIALFTIPAMVLEYFSRTIPASIVEGLSPLVLQSLISLPVLMTFAMIVSGLMFELGQGSAISSSEAVNWLPVSPREYVIASALSTSSLYSAFLALAAGVMLPLAAEFGFFHLWPMAVLLSLVGLLLGAFIVEFLRAIMNRVSSTAYKRSGRFTMLTRLIALVLLFSIIQMAFQPYVLYWILGQIAGGIEVAWVVPIVWPSVALIGLARFNLISSAVFTLLSVLFAMAVYETACQLRRKYWSPIPILISVSDSGGYLPQAPIRTGFGFNPLASTLAMKEFRALLRRKELSRFIAIPVVMAISFLVPMLAQRGDVGRGNSGFFLAAFMPLFVPLMFSTISIGQEGNSIMNLLSLPITPTDLIKGKLAPAWLISSMATFGMIAIMQIIAPLGLIEILVMTALSAIVILINSFIGLGVGARWPDYTVGSRSRYITLKGFFIGFILSGLATVTVFAPVGVHIVTGGSVLGLDLLLMFIISMAFGGTLIALSYLFCKRGVKDLLSNT